MDGLNEGQVDRVRIDRPKPLGTKYLIRRIPANEKTPGRAGKGKGVSIDIVDDCAVQNCHALILACAACAALTPIHVFSTRPRSFCMSELQSFMTSSAPRLLRKFTMPAGRSIRAHTVPATTSRQSVSSACWGVRSRRAVRRTSVMRV